MGDSEKLTGIFQNMLVPVPGTINPSGVSLPPTDARDTPFVNYASSLDESGQQALLMELQSVPLATKAILKTLAPGIPEKQQGLLKNIQGEVVELDQSIKKLLLSLWTDDSDGDKPSEKIQ